MILIVSSIFIGIYFTNFLSAQDITSQQNDIIPNQALNVPVGKFCYFTCSELIFEDRMQQVAPSAYRVGAARLVDLKIISLSTYEPYQSVWGALYYVERDDYQNLIIYAQSQNPVAFVATAQVETIENQGARCVLTDYTLQANSYLSTWSCERCDGSGSGGSTVGPSANDYRMELQRMGVPSTYLLMVGQLPTMPQPAPSMRDQKGGQEQAAPQQLPVSQPASGGSVAAETAVPATSWPPHQLNNPYENASPTPLTTNAQPQTFRKPKSPPPPYVPFQNQFLPESGALYTRYPSTSVYQPATPPSVGTSGTSSGTYQPMYNFSASQGSVGNAQSQLIPGFTIASSDPNFAYLQPWGGLTFVDYQAYFDEQVAVPGANPGLLY